MRRFNPLGVQIMNRTEFRKFFKSTGPAVLPVIHVVDVDQVTRNVNTAMQCGAQGVFLINHDFSVDRFLPIIHATRQRFPALWLGINFLAVTGREAFPILARLQQDGCTVDAYWADDACIDESSDTTQQYAAQAINNVKQRCGWQGMYFGGIAFKKQRTVDLAGYVLRRHRLQETTHGRPGRLCAVCGTRCTVYGRGNHLGHRHGSAG